MEDLNFWHNWPKREKYLYFFIFTVFLVIGIGLMYYVFFGTDLNWMVATTIERVPVAAQSMTTGILEFPVEADLMYVTQQFKVGNYEVNLLVPLLFVLTLAFAFNILLTAASFFKTWWYFGVLGMFVIALSFFKFDLLLIYSDTRNIFLIILIVLFVGVNLLFNIRFTHVDFSGRFITFLGVTFLVAIIIYHGANVENPVLYISNYGFYVPLALSIVFIILIAFDIIYFFLYVITSSKSASGKSNSLNFIVISVLYLANLALMYCKKTGIIHWDLLYIDEFLLLFLSILVGVWAYRMRLEATSTVMNFAPYGAMFYLGMAIVTVASVVYSFATANDQLVEVLRDVVLYSHLAIGSVFLIYVIFNFSTYINRNLKVFEVVLKINRFPVHLVRVGGLVLATGLLVKSNFKQIYKTEAGYSAGIADVYLNEGNVMFAEEYLNESLFHYPLTQKSNLAYAHLKDINGRYEDAVDHYKKIQMNQESEQMYASIAYNYSKAGLPFSAMETLHEGISKFPKSSMLYNNLGVVFAKTHILDSTYYFLNKADQLGGEQDVSRTNIISFLIKKNLIKELPSYMNEPTDYLPLQTNKIALMMLRKEDLGQNYWYPRPDDTISTIERFAYHYNYGISNLHKVDTLYDRFTTCFLKNDTLSIFRNELGLVKAYKKYYSGNRREAFKEIFDLYKENSSRGGFYFNLLGIWSIENNAPLLAADFFGQAIENGNSASRINQIVALIAAGKKQDAVEMLTPLTHSTDQTERTLAISIISNLKLENQITDQARLNYLLTNKAILNTSEFELNYDAIVDLPLRKRASILLLEHYLKTKNLTKAKYMPLANDLPTQVQKKLNLLKLEQFRLLGEFNVLLKKADSVSLNQEDESQRLFYKAVAMEYTGNKIESQRLYKLALTKLPLNESLIVNYSNYQHKYESSEAAYNTLLDAILLNPYGVEIQKAYCLKALELNLESYASETLDKIKLLTNSKDYEQFKLTYLVAKRKVDSVLNWN